MPQVRDAWQSDPLGGVQRYAAELVKAMDRLLASGARLRKVVDIERL
jgi:hypothetical protein